MIFSVSSAVSWQGRFGTCRREVGLWTASNSSSTSYSSGLISSGFNRTCPVTRYSGNETNAKRKTDRSAPVAGSKRTEEPRKGPPSRQLIVDP